MDETANEPVTYQKLIASLKKVAKITEISAVMTIPVFEYEM